MPTLKISTSGAKPIIFWKCALYTHEICTQKKPDPDITIKCFLFKNIAYLFERVPAFDASRGRNY